MSAWLRIAFLSTCISLIVTGLWIFVYHFVLEENLYYLILCVIAHGAWIRAQDYFTGLHRQRLTDEYLKETEEYIKARGNDDETS